MTTGDRDDPGSAEVFGGWALRSFHPTEITADLKSYGQVFRVPVAEGPRTRALAAGQPCFLLVEAPGNESFKPAIWAVGEVVAGVTDRADGSLVAEVELLPLQERIRRADLAEHPVLAGGELADPPGDQQLLRLSRAEVRVLEDRDLDFRPPSPEQEANLALALDEVDAELHALYGE